MLKYILLFVLTVILVQLCPSLAQPKLTKVSPLQMQKVYNEVKTPFKYGLVFGFPNREEKG